jgi:NhaP-type Na+/H+ or K+/H+ antiporter
VNADALYLLAGASLLLAVLLPGVLRSFAISPPLVLLLVGVALGWTPLADDLQVDVVADRALVEHVAELTVLIALMGVGLALDRPLDLLKPGSWRSWSSTWRLLGIAMPITIGGVALLGWGLGLAPAAALLLGSVLAPTDPVLASDVQVGGPGSSIPDDAADDLPYAEDPTVSSESGEVRFALTSEAGLNDGLAFPFVHGAILVAAGGSLLTDVGEWLAWYVVAKIVIGVLAGVLLGRLLGKLVFRARSQPLRLAEQGEPLAALAALLAAYGVGQLLQGYGFLAVFACAMAMRSAERSHDYHRAMHDVVERLERLFTLLILLLLGIALSGGLLDALDWRGILVAVASIVVIRPLSGLVALGVAPRREPEAGGLSSRGRAAVAFFGVRGVGSIYYLAYATGEVHLPEAPWLWSTVGFTIALSALVHGVAATPVMTRLNEEPSTAI